MPTPATAPLPTPTHRSLPRWRGFNLLEQFSAHSEHHPHGPFREDDFRFLADHGFNFVRLPLDYRLLLVDEKPFTHNPAAWSALDDALAFGERHNVHVNIAIHRAPGYCCNPPFETVDLFRDAAPRDLFIWFWQQFATRYKNVDPAHLSFNLLNEPAAPSREQAVAAVMRAALKEIHAVRADRVVIADGLCWGRWGGAGTPSFALANDPIAQSVHCYEPAWLTFHQMNKKDPFLNGPAPTWPGRLEVPPDQCAEYPHELYMLGSDPWDKSVLRDYYFGPWRGLQALGVGLHAGELAIFRHTPHNVALAYLEDLLSILHDMNIGFAMWNLRGPFGIVNSYRTDASYQDTPLGPLDTKMLALLEKY